MPGRQSAERFSYSRLGGRCLGGPPVVWVLSDDKPGHTTQSIALAEALGWPYEVKELHFTGLSQLSNHLLGATQIGLNRTRSAPLAPPWPDLVIATGRRTAPVARWIRRQSIGRSRLVQLGRKGGEVAEWFDLVVTPAYYRLSSHPHRIETVAPLNSVSPEQLEKANESCGNVFRDAPHPRVVLLVGGANGGHQLGKVTARRVGKEMRAFARASGGSVVAVTSGGTTTEAIKALRRGLGESSRVYGRRPGEQETLYLACLGQADAIVVAGESESLLAEAAASGKPVYLNPLPKRQPGLKQQLQDWVEARSKACPLNKRGTVRPQQGLEHFCAWLIARGFVHPRRDLEALSRSLMRLGVARPFGEPLETGTRPPLREADKVAGKVQELLGFVGSSV